jgi:hypothetical protein
VALELAPLAAERFKVSPWPFDRSAFTLRIDGRRLPRLAYDDEAGFHAALRAARWEPQYFAFEE